MKLLLNLLFCFFSLFCFSQNEQEIQSIQTDSFPKVEIRFHTRNPNPLAKEKVTLSESTNKIEKFDFEILKSKDSSKGKCVFILFENHYASSRNAERNFFKQLLNSSASQFIGSQDEFYLASFDFVREKTKPVLNFEIEKAENNVQNFQQKVNAISPKSNLGYTADYGKSTQIFRALNEALEFLQTTNSNKTKAIFLLSAEFSYSYDQEFDNDVPIIQKAKKYNISVYTIGYNIGMSSTHRVGQVAEQTYGSSVYCNDNELKKAEDSLRSFMNLMEARSLGKTYQIKYTSEKGGNEVVPIEIKTPEGIINSTFKSPFSYSGFFKKNWIWFAGLLIIIICIVFFLIKRMKKSKEEKNELVKKQSDLGIHLQQQNAEIERIKREKAEVQSKLSHDKLTSENEKKEAELKKLLALMSASGFPKLTIHQPNDGQNQSYQVFVDFPEFTIGRNEKNHLRLNSQIVSGNHAMIQFIDGQYYLKDLGSTNGTKLNGVQISQAILNDGAKIEIGDALITFYK